MRLRNNKNALPYLLANEDKVYLFKDVQFNLPEIFKNSNPFHLEIGSGKGQMLFNLAKANPNINFLALDKYPSVLYQAVKKQEEVSLENLRYLLLDAKDLLLALPAHSISRIYLTFSDPWPKARHEKRRLTSPNFLALFKELLKENGDIIFKTDNLPFFNYSLEKLIEEGFTLEEVSYDLAASDIPNEMTEFETKFQETTTINYLRARVC